MRKIIEAHRILVKIKRNTAYMIHVYLLISGIRNTSLCNKKSLSNSKYTICVDVCGFNAETLVKLLKAVSCIYTS